MWKPTLTHGHMSTNYISCSWEHKLKLFLTIIQIWVHYQENCWPFTFVSFFTNGVWDPWPSVPRTCPHGVQWFQNCFTWWNRTTNLRRSNNYVRVIQRGGRSIAIQHYRGKGLAAHDEIGLYIYHQKVSFFTNCGQIDMFGDQRYSQ